MKEYKAQVHNNGDTFWFNSDDQRHREDGPAVEYVTRGKYWYLNGWRLTEKEFNNRTQPVTELTVADVERLVGHKVKIVKELKHETQF